MEIIEANLPLKLPYCYPPDALWQLSDMSGHTFEKGWSTLVQPKALFLNGMKTKMYLLHASVEHLIHDLFKPEMCGVSNIWLERRTFRSDGVKERRVQVCSGMI